MMQQVTIWQQKIDALSVRERAVIFLGLIVVLFSIWDAALLAPMENEQKRIKAALNNKNAEHYVLVQQIQELAKPESDPDAANLQKLKELRSRLVSLKADLEQSTANLVSPQDMPKILETVLHKTAGVNLLGLKSTGAKPLIVTDDKDAAKEENTGNKSAEKITAENIDNAYYHGFRIRFTGDYFSTIKYLKALEQLNWGFYWEKLDYAVKEYPDAEIAIDIFTLSLQPDWMGV